PEDRKPDYHESLVGSEMCIRDSEHIAPLQDAVDLEIATEEENSLLEAWKKYRVLLNRVDTSTAPDIEWPEEPDTM
ncbi:tail fiber assembly protein, partial [Escherichia coli]|uniref:tail fiber assembly protein n=1 Tax=Escherichia coli TaxID=562 RepID=UPI0021E8C730